MPISRPYHRPGFTLVELLVVVLIVSILMAIAVPMYLSVVGDSELKTARTNMQSIANAMQAYKIRDVSHSYPPSISQLSGDLGRDFSPSVPSAPGPGTRTYSIIFSGSCTNSDGDAIPVSPFAVQSSVSSDGCYVPGYGDIQ